MNKLQTEQTTGAWIIHHGKKIKEVPRAEDEFPALDGAAKAGLLLSSMSASKERELSGEQVQAFASAAGINPKTELKGFIDELTKRELVDVSKTGSMRILGVSSIKVLEQTSKIFKAYDPQETELATIDIAEMVSHRPMSIKEVAEATGDKYEFPRSHMESLLTNMQYVGLIDSEGDGTSKVLFNGNLFRRDTLAKTKIVLDSLSSAEVAKVTEASDMLKSAGCYDRADLVKVLGEALFSKLMAAGFYDVNSVSNTDGEHAYITDPAAFHKYVDPMVDDAFDDAKALVASITYGIQKSGYSRGRISMPEKLINALINGNEIGPATAIGQDYKVLETRGVIKLRREQGSGMYYMRLLKREVGEIALQVIMRGGSNENVLKTIPLSAMAAYAAPEVTRSKARKAQGLDSRRRTHDVLQALREG